MVWSPNIAYGYPYMNDGYDEYNPRPNHPDPIRAANFRALDTNNDGRLTETDDAYEPYYPGDEYVDWVGISVYNTGRDARTRQTSPANPNIVAAYISSSTNALFDFYGRFSAAKNKPFMISETGSAFVTNYTVGDTALELSVKQSWWTSILNAAVRSRNFPNWKAAVWFEEIKPEQSYDDHTQSVMKDYRITFSEPVKAALMRDLTAEPRIVWADSLRYTCNGSISVAPSPKRS
jgi:hypothetical protein